MEGLGFIGQSLQQFIIDAILILVQSVQLVQNLTLVYFQLVVPFFDSEQLFKSWAKITLLFEVHLIELPAILNSEKLCNLCKALFSGAFELFQDIFNALDIFYFFIFRAFALFDLPVQHIIVFLLGVEEWLNFLDMIGWLCPYEAFEGLFNTIQLSTDFHHFSILLFELSGRRITCLSMAFNFSRITSISFYNFRFLAQNCSERSS